MDERIERKELTEEKPAPLTEEVVAEAVENETEAATDVATDAAPAPAEASEADEQEASEAPAEEEKATVGNAVESDELAAEDADAPLVMPAPVEAPEAMAMPETPAPAPIPAGPAAKLFNGLSYIGLPLLLIFAAAMSFLEVWQVRDLWCADEARLADVLANVKGGDWLVRTLNGAP